MDDDLLDFGSQIFKQPQDEKSNKSTNNDDSATQQRTSTFNSSIVSSGNDINSRSSSASGSVISNSYVSPLLAQQIVSQSVNSIDNMTTPTSNDNKQCLSTTSSFEQQENEERVEEEEEEDHNEFSQVLLDSYILDFEDYADDSDEEMNQNILNDNNKRVLPPSLISNNNSNIKTSPTNDLKRLKRHSTSSSLSVNTQEDENNTQEHDDDVPKTYTNQVIQQKDQSKQQIQSQPSTNFTSEVKRKSLPSWMRQNSINIDGDTDVLKKYSGKSSQKRVLLDSTDKDNPDWLQSLRGFDEIEQPILQGRVVCFDLETSGFGPDDSIIEIGAVELINGCRTGLTFQSYAKPKAPIHPAAQQIHQLSNVLLRDAPPIEFVLASFMDFVGDALLVAHNLAFDRRMLLQELVRSKTPFNMHHKCFCTMRYFRRMYKDSNYSLDSVSQHLKINKLLLRRTHGALVDSEILAIVYKHLLSLPSNFADLKIFNRLEQLQKISNNNSNDKNNNVNDNNTTTTTTTTITTTPTKNVNNQNINNDSLSKSNTHLDITEKHSNNEGCILNHLDHIVLTTRDVDKCVNFYVDVLGLQKEIFGEGRIALKFGKQKINIHRHQHEFKPHAQLPTPGSLDLCFISTIPLRDVLKKLILKDVNIEEGPIPRTGANGKILSVYVRDPDQNLIEISEYLKD